jgi:hypothetical protein
VQGTLEIYRSPRIGALHDAGKETGIIRAQQVPPFLHAIGELLELLVENLLVACVDLLQGLLDLFRKLFVRALVNERDPQIGLISCEVDQLLPTGGLARGVDDHL